MVGFLKGTITAIITPFSRDGVNVDVLKEIIERQIQGGVSGIVVLGTTGESCTMDEEEKVQAIKYAVRSTAGRMKVLVGTGSNSTRKAMLDSKRAEALGADGILAVTPYYNKCSQQGLFEYYASVAAAVEIPVICYNVPSRTGVNLLPETMAKIAEIPNIAGIKDASGDMKQTLETLRLIRGKCDLYSGDDALNLPILLSGGKAVISVVSNLAPEKVCALVNAALSGDLEEAVRLNDSLHPLISACFLETNPIPVKYGMNLLGLNAGIPRAPLSVPQEDTRRRMKESILACGLKGMK